MRESLTDEEAAESFDLVDVWVAAPPAPKEVWSLADAVRWIEAQPDSAKTALYRPPGGARRTAWIGADQLARLALLLSKKAANTESQAA